MFVADDAKRHCVQRKQTNLLINLRGAGRMCAWAETERGIISGYICMWRQARLTYSDEGSALSLNDDLVLHGAESVMMLRDPIEERMEQLFRETKSARVSQKV
jgi:hypothetical protein